MSPIKFAYKSTVALLAASLVLTSPLSAQEVDNRANIYGGAVDYIFDSEWNQDDAWGWLFGAEVPLSERWGGALEYWNLDSDLDVGPGDSELEYIRLGGNYHLLEQNGWQPYVGVGIGHLKVNPKLVPGGASESAFDLGVGVKRFFNDNLFFRGDVKTIHVNDVNNWDFSIGLAFGYAFGPKSRPAPPPEPAPVVVDPDSDGDGVPDSRDRCANTPRNLAVDDDGCPILDRTMMSQELLVEFDFDQSVIKPEFYQEIADFAQFMMTYANTSVVIEGHTDSVGTDAYNQGLSERRAQAVVTRLINTHGIAASRLSAVGYGESRPVVPNTSAENRARNRRIMAEVSVEVETQRLR